VFCLIDVVEHFGGESADAPIEGLASAAEVVDQEADEVAESAVEAIFDHVLSSGCGWRYLPMYFWMTHHLVPTCSWMSYSFYS
jgi:hypothetical protein